MRKILPLNRLKTIGYLVPRVPATSEHQSLHGFPNMVGGSLEGIPNVEDEHSADSACSLWDKDVCQLQVYVQLFSYKLYDVLISHPGELVKIIWKIAYGHVICCFHMLSLLRAPNRIGDGPTYKHIVRPSPIRCGTLNTPKQSHKYFCDLPILFPLYTSAIFSAVRTASDFSTSRKIEPPMKLGKKSSTSKKEALRTTKRIQEMWKCKLK